MNKVNLMRLLLVLLLAIALLSYLTIGAFTVFGQTDQPPAALRNLLPQFDLFQWSYLGFVDYGHDMAVNSIVVTEETIEYHILGNVHDLSEGEADADFSLAVSYILTSDSLIQVKDEETMMDSAYDRIELVRMPLEAGNQWTQEVENEDGATTLESEIISVENGNSTVYTIRYEDVNSEYYEQREIEESIGVIAFEKLMFTDDGETYTVHYSLFDEGTGIDLETDFHDLDEDEWYMDTITPLVAMDLISGYPDRTFRPDSSVTVAEFITLTVKSLGYHPEASDGEWFNPYVSTAMGLEIIDENDFDDYNRPITREEMAVVIVRALDEDPQTDNTGFTDEANISPDYLTYINTAVNLELIDGYPDNTFRPAEETTRAEASTLIPIIVDEIMSRETFTISKALDLETSFFGRLLQESDDWDFDDREALIDHMFEIADRELAEDFVDEFYDETDGEFELIPRDGPIRLFEDEPYELRQIHPRQYQLIQSTHTELTGDYTLTVTYAFEDQRWIMKNREVETPESS